MRAMVVGLLSLAISVLAVPVAQPASALSPVPSVQGFQTSFVRWDAGHNVYHLSWWGRGDAVDGFAIGYLRGSREVVLPRDEVTRVGGDAVEVDVTVDGDGEFVIQAFRGSPTQYSEPATASAVGDGLLKGIYGLQAWPVPGTASTVRIARAGAVRNGDHVVVRRSQDPSLLLTPESGEWVGPIDAAGEALDDIGAARTMAYRLFEVVDAHPEQWIGGEVVSTVASPLPVRSLRLSYVGEDHTKLVATWQRPAGCGADVQEVLGCGLVQVQLKPGGVPPQYPGEGDEPVRTTADTSLTFTGLTPGTTYSLSAWTTYGPGAHAGSLSEGRSAPSVSLRGVSALGWVADPPWSVTFGQTVRLEGEAFLGDQGTPLPNARVRLEGSAGASAPTVLAAATTDASGRVSFSIRPSGSSAYRITTAGTGAWTGSESPWATISVRPTVSATASVVTAQPNSSFTVSGAVGPHVPGSVLLQRKAGSTWQTVARSTANTGGAYRFSTRWSKPGLMDYRVVRPGDTKLQTGISRIVSIEISPIRLARTSYNAPGADRPTTASVNGEYVTVSNVGSAARSLTGWTIRNAAGRSYRFGRLTLAAGRSVIVRTGRGTDHGTIRYWGLSRHVWSNTADRAILRDAHGSTVDSCSWKSPGTGATNC